MAIFYAAIRSRKLLKSKKRINVGTSILIALLVGGTVVGVVGSDSFVPDSMHVAYLILPLYSAGVGCITTKMADIFLRIVVKE